MNSAEVGTIQETQFDRVIAPLSREAFLSQYWGKTYHHQRGAPGRFKDLFPWETLNLLLEQDLLQPPRMKMCRDGKVIETAQYMTAARDRLRLKASSMTNLLSEGATLIIDGVDELTPCLRNLTADFEEVLGTRIWINLYAGFRTEKGFDLHWDPQDVIILQLDGRKRWQVHAPTRAHPLDEDVEGPARPAGDPAWEGVLENGDMLYMPRGWWHVAFPMDEPSLHITLTIVPANGVDLLEWCVNQLKRRPEVRMDIPSLAGPSVRKHYLEQLRELIAESLSDDSVERFLALWESQIPLRPEMRLPLPRPEQRAPLTFDTSLRLAANRRLSPHVPPGKDSALFQANGSHWECGADLIPALEALSATHGQTVGELAMKLPKGASPLKLIAFLSALAQRGVVWMDDTQKSA